MEKLRINMAIFGINVEKTKMSHFVNPSIKIKMYIQKKENKIKMDI